MEAEVRDKMAKDLIARIRNAEFRAGMEECEHGSGRKQERETKKADRLTDELLALLGEDREPVAWISPRKLRLLAGSRGANRKWVQVSPFPHDEHDQALHLHPPTGGEVVAMLKSIEQYGSDTLSGRADGPVTIEWLWEGVKEMRDRARKALTYATEGGEDG